MGPTLLPYVIPKIHTFIRSNLGLESIIVVGKHDRSPPAIATASEKPDKLFNWQRPTMSAREGLDGTEVQLNVFPGRAYVSHYAALVATYLASQALTNIKLRCVLPPPDACASLFKNSNLPRLGSVEIVVLGYVDSLANSTGPGAWETGADINSSAAGAEEEAELFAWKKREVHDGRQVAFLGCRTSYWGDIAGQLIRELREQSGMQAVVYVGKMGTLDARHAPNSVLGTGSRSIFATGGCVEWESELERAITGVEGIVKGTHVTVATSLCESKEWASEWRKKADWVDPEIGQMALACVEGGVGFGYLHVVSDNLSLDGGPGLANERVGSILESRAKLLETVEEVLERYFNEDRSEKGKCAAP